MKRKGRIPFLPFLLLGFSLPIMEGCLGEVTGPGRAETVYLYRDSGDVNATGAFHRVGAPFSLMGIKPSQEVAYWEERIASDTNGFFVVGSSVDTCGSRTLPCPGPLAAYRSDRGEAGGGLISPRSHTYFVGWTGTKIVAWNDRDATHSFLGRIDSEADALFWAGHQGYEAEDSAYIASSTGGYELLMNRLDSRCHPYRLLRVKVFMDFDGDSQEIGRETLEESEEKCLYI